MEDKMQLEIWNDRDKCLRLLKYWGGYNDVGNDPLRKEFIETISELIDGLTKSPVSLLDVGCGTGHNLWPFRDRAELTGLDYSEEMINLITEKFKGHNLKVDQGSCWKLPYKQKVFDIVIQMDVCSHLGGSWESIKEMLRVSKKYVVFTGPSFEDWTDVMDKRIEEKLSWGVSQPLLERRLNRRKVRYYYVPRPQHGNIKHRILVVEKA